MGLDRAAAWRTWRTYRGTGIATQAFIAARMAVAPLGPLEEILRGLRGRIISVGCGHGAVDRYVGEINPEVSIDGFDLDAKRIAIAQATEGRAPRVRARVGDATKPGASQPFDGALLIDVLHHIPFADHRSVLRGVRQILRPGATCVVKEMATTPSFRYRWNRFHDRIVGSPEIYCRSPDDLARLLREGGFDTSEPQRLKRLGLYPQFVIVATAR